MKPNLEVAKKIKAVEDLQNFLVAFATGEGGDEPTYARLRQSVLADLVIAKKMPDFVRRCRSQHQFWEFIKGEFAHYFQRRQFLWGEFRPILESLESDGNAPIDETATPVLSAFDEESVGAIWRKALERRNNDPEGAITIARTLLETVCKNILDEEKQAYEEAADLPKLYSFTAKLLRVSPSQHAEPVIKQILGGCTAVVEGLGALRNRLSDAHGKGKKPVKPAPRHAELAVNLAGAMATFLVSTWKHKKSAI